MGLLKPAWKSNNEKRAIKEVGGETSQAILAEIAKNAPLKTVRESAIRKITDQSLLADVAINYGYEESCKAAINKMSDQKQIARVALEAQSPNINIIVAAIDKLNDQKLLERVALEVEYMVREHAVDKLTNQVVLTNIAKTDKHPKIRKCAIKKLIDQKVLSEIIASDEDPNVCSTALDMLTEQNALINIAKNRPSSSKNGRNKMLRVSAIKKIADQKTLIDIANDTNEDDSSNEFIIIYAA